MAKKRTDKNASPSAKGVPIGIGSHLKIAGTSSGWKAKCKIARDARKQDGYKFGRPTAFKSPEQMYMSCMEYFAWCEENPFEEHITKFNKDGDWVDHKVPKKRPFTKQGLHLYLDINEQTWINYKTKEEYADIVAEVNASIYDQKITNAMSGFFNASVVMRDLGLADKQEVRSPDASPTMVITNNFTPQQAAEAYAKTRKGE